jgi:hypothetical protein
MEPDYLEKRILKRALENPGLFSRDLYRPYLNERSESFLWSTVKCLISCGYLRTYRTGSRVKIYTTARTKRLFRTDQGAKK